MYKQKHSAKQVNNCRGFTIVELLVVILVIGVLASIVAIAYSNISQRAEEATLKSDLKNASVTLAMDRVNDGDYPSSEELANGGSGLPKSDGTSYQYTQLTDDYCLTATYGDTAFYVLASTGAIESGVCDGHLQPGETEIPITSGWRQIVNGASHTCGVSYDYKAYCWGSSSFGQVGYGSAINKSVPTQVTSTGVLAGLTIKSVYLDKASNYSCAIASDDKAYCWGSNINGMLGNNSTSNSLVPARVDITGVLAGKNIRTMAMNGSTTCVVTTDGLPYCWGYNANGDLGNNSTVRSLVPVAVDMTGVLSGKTVKSIDMGLYGGVCVIASDDKAYCWGDNSNGRLGNNSTTDALVPVAVDTSGVLGGKTIKELVMHYPTTCVIASDNLPYCWGYNADGELGNNSTTNSSVPVAVDTSGVLSGKTVKDIVIEDDSACVIASDNKPYCWGYGGVGRLGNNSTSSSSVPVAVYTEGALSGKNISSIYAGYETYCVIDTAGVSYCWGWNVYGKLGGNIPAGTNSSVPVAVYTSGVLNGKTVNSIEMSSYHTCAILSDNSAACWGWGTSGQLGNNAILDSMVPVSTRQPL